MVAGRIVQGVGAAALLPLSLALVARPFPAISSRRRAGSGPRRRRSRSGSRPLAGGADRPGWRLIFGFNLPIAALGLHPDHRVGGAGSARRERDPPSRRAGLDHPDGRPHAGGPGAGRGQLLGLGLCQDDWEFRSRTGLLGAFWLVEHPRATADRRIRAVSQRSLLRRHGRRLPDPVRLLDADVLWPQYLQNQLDYSATATGLLILPITAPVIAVSPFRGADRPVRGTPLMTVGMLFALGGLILLTRIDAGTGCAVLRCPASCCSGSRWGSCTLDVSRGDGGDARREGEDRLRGAGHEPRPGRCRGAGRDRRDLPRCGRTIRSFSLANSLWVLVGVAAAGVALTWAFVRSRPRRPLGLSRAAPPPSPPLSL